MCNLDGAGWGVRQRVIVSVGSFRKYVMLFHPHAFCRNESTFDGVLRAGVLCFRWHFGRWKFKWFLNKWVWKNSSNLLKKVTKSYRLFFCSFEACFCSCSRKMSEHVSRKRAIFSLFLHWIHVNIRCEHTHPYTSSFVSFPVHPGCHTNFNYVPFRCDSRERERKRV